MEKETLMSQLEETVSLIGEDNDINQWVILLQYNFADNSDTVYSCGDEHKLNFPHACNAVCDTLPEIFKTNRPLQCMTTTSLLLTCIEIYIREKRHYMIM